MERETFQSRLGFLLLSAGCAIGIGNVWKFPYMVGNNGGGIFVLFYLLFLAIMGVPILSMELAIGRGSKKSTVRAYGELEKKGQKWHIHGYVALIGNYLLMMFYTVVAGWMLYYFYSFLTGKFSGLTGGRRNRKIQRDAFISVYSCHHDAADHDCRLSDLLCWSAEWCGACHKSDDDCTDGRYDFPCGLQLYNARRKRGSEILSGAGQAAD